MCTMNINKEGQWNHNVMGFTRPTLIFLLRIMNEKKRDFHFKKTGMIFLEKKRLARPIRRPDAYGLNVTYLNKELGEVDQKVLQNPCGW